MTKFIQKTNGHYFSQQEFVFFLIEQITFIFTIFLRNGTVDARIIESLIDALRANIARLRHKVVIMTDN